MSSALLVGNAQNGLRISSSSTISVPFSLHSLSRQIKNITPKSLVVECFRQEKKCINADAKAKFLWLLGWLDAFLAKSYY